MIDELIERLETNLNELEYRIQKYKSEPEESLYTINEIIIFKQTIEDIKRKLRMLEEY